MLALTAMAAFWFRSAQPAGTFYLGRSQQLVTGTQALSARKDDLRGSAAGRSSR